MNNITNKPQVERIFTKLKFTKSEQTGAIVSFVSQNPKTGQIRGVRQDDPYPKKICILDRALSSSVLLNTLYDATLVPMTSKDGFVAISITPVQFKAKIEVTVCPKALYKVEVKFGNKVILFDPMDGKRDSVKKLAECKRVLETRVDIKDLLQVVEDFEETAYSVIAKYEQDGFIYRWK